MGVFLEKMDHVLLGEVRKCLYELLWGELEEEVVDEPFAAKGRGALDRQGL